MRLNTPTCRRLFPLSAVIMVFACSEPTGLAAPTRTAAVPGSLRSTVSASSLFQAEFRVKLVFGECNEAGVCHNVGTGTGHATRLGEVEIAYSTFRQDQGGPCPRLTGTRTLTTPAGPADAVGYGMSSAA
jgi:hypothetical protein